MTYSKTMCQTSLDILNRSVLIPTDPKNTKKNIEKTINNIKKAALTLTSSNKVRIKQKAIDKSKFDIKETFEILEGEKIIKIWILYLIFFNYLEEIYLHFNPIQAHIYHGVFCSIKSSFVTILSESKILSSAVEEILKDMKKDQSKKDSEIKTTYWK